MNTAAIFISESFDFYLQTPCTQLNFSETDPIHRYQMNIVGLLLFCLNGTIWIFVLHSLPIFIFFVFHV
ncbi:hypothetical protein GLYMA_09G093500v4 [Glycine max]|uniref:Uncharacterized protein n=1 Tax=Glycine max TaxID=3847 RepID=A0A0R0I620_SOYBN|nr:hypothetical protein GYH30_024521 [Glycine max]KRH37850.1 hypothetical protein GLYMA_09G093500v4 [Glycine max]